MNYLKLINAFYDYQIEHPLTACEQALWHRLVAYCNSYNWKKDFTLTNLRVADDLGISRQQLDRARNMLVQKGLISYKKRSGNQCGVYQIVELVTLSEQRFVTNNVTQVDTQMDTHSAFVTNNVTQIETQADTQSDTQSGHSPLPLDKPKRKPKPKQDTITPKPLTLFVDYADGNAELLSALEGFAAMRKAMKKPLATDRAQQLLLAKLDGMTTDVGQKIALLDMAVTGGWQSIYVPKEGLKPSAPRKASYDLDEMERHWDTVPQLE